MTDTLFSMPDSAPDPLTAARQRLAKAQAAHDAAEAVEDPEGYGLDHFIEMELMRAEHEVAKLEAAALDLARARSRLERAGKALDEASDAAESGIAPLPVSWEYEDAEREVERMEAAALAQRRAQA